MKFSTIFAKKTMLLTSDDCQEGIVKDINIIMLNISLAYTHVWQLLYNDSSNW